MTINNAQEAWLQRNRSMAGATAIVPSLEIPYVLPPSEIAGLSKYLDTHRFAVVQIEGKAGLAPADYEIRLDDKPLGFYEVVGVLMKQIPEGQLGKGPITDAALAQITPLVEDRYQSALNKAMAARNTQSPPTGATPPTQSPPAGATPPTQSPPAGATPPDLSGKSTTLPVTTPSPTKHDDKEAEKLYEIDLDNMRKIAATNSGNPPPDPQFSLKLTKHVEAWATKSSGDKPTWTFKLFDDLSVALQSNKNFKLTDQFSENIGHLIWDSHLLPATELSLQVNASIFLDKQVGAQLELEQPLSSEVSLIVDGTFDYGKGPDQGTTNWAVTAGLEFKIFGWGKKK
jgi:hypothetical protein